jgi:hypothetical protein
MTFEGLNTFTPSVGHGKTNIYPPSDATRVILSHDASSYGGHPSLSRTTMLSTVSVDSTGLYDGLRALKVASCSPVSSNASL